MRTSMATVSLGGTLADKIDAIAHAGFDALELLDADLWRSPMSARECASRCADRGVAIDIYQPFRGAEGVTATEYDTVLTRFRYDLAVMEELGADVILVVSNTDPTAIGDFDLSVEQVAGLADLASDHGVTIVFESLCWGTHLSTLDQAHRLVCAVDRPNVKLAVDSFHLIAGGESPAVIDQIEASTIGYFQLADAPYKDLDLLQWSRNYRCFPGEGDFDLADPVTRVFDIGYRGTTSLEIFNASYREQPPVEVAARGYASLAQSLSLMSHLSPA